MTQTSQLLLPVYLNQRAVFDLVAMLQGGISTVTKISETAKELTSTDREVGAAFGLNRAFASLLRIDLSAKRRKMTDEESGRTSSEERVHTPASLFFVLRALLSERALLVQDTESQVPESGQFLEFSAVLRRNPVVEVTDALHQMMSLAFIFFPPTEAKHKKGQQLGTDQKAQLKQLEQFRDVLRSGDTIDLTTDPLRSGHRAVVTVETQYLNDPSMSDLVDGTFTVVGKVTRVIGEGEGSVNLVRKTALGPMPPAVLEQAFASLAVPLADQGFHLPNMTWRIDGPVIQLLPIAIFT